MSLEEKAKFNQPGHENKSLIDSYLANGGKVVKCDTVIGTKGTGDMRGFVHCKEAIQAERQGCVT